MEKHKLPQRKKIRLKNCDYSGGSSYFVTICLKKTTDLFLWDKEKTEKWIEFSSPVFLVDTSEAKENSTSDYDVVFENLPLSEAGLTVKRQIEKNCRSLPRCNCAFLCYNGKSYSFIG